MKQLFLNVLLGVTLMVSGQQKSQIYLDVTKPIEDRVENALSLMTTEEKVALCHAQSKPSSSSCGKLISSV